MMKIKNLFALLFVGVTLSACSTRENKTTSETALTLPKASAETEAILRKSFPGAVKAPEFGDSILRYLHRKYGIVNSKMLLGVSTCVDDIIYTKNFHMHPDIKGPFHLGGLAGLPFTGVLGLKAFAHHIPDSGSLLLLIEPHIGYSEKQGWGYILRHEQHNPSACCGALMETLDRLQEGTLDDVISEENYQGDKIAELALRHKKEILSSDSPIVELTRVTSRAAEKQIRAHVVDMAVPNVKYIVILTGVMINTDYNLSDYQFIDHFMVYDAQKKIFIEDLHNSGNRYK
jgi:hypothetical protein